MLAIVVGALVFALLVYLFVSFGTAAQYAHRNPNPDPKPTPSPSPNPKPFV